MKLGITMLTHNKDDIEFVTEFPCLLEHPLFTHEKSTLPIQDILGEYIFIFGGIHSVWGKFVREKS